MNATIGLLRRMLKRLFPVSQRHINVRRRLSNSRRAKKRDEQNAQISRALSLQQATLESTHDGILAVDLNNNWVVYNQRFIDLWQIPQEVLASRDRAAKVLPFALDQVENPGAFADKVRELYATPLAKSFDVIHFKDGKIVERHSIPQLIDGKVVGRVWSFRDITESKRREEALMMTQFVSDHAPDGIVWVNEQGRNVYVNEAACIEHGYSMEEMLAMTVHDIDPDFPAEVWPEHWQMLKKSGRLKFETRHRRKDGSIFPIEVSANFVQFEDKEFNVAFIRNISERKIAEAELRIAAIAFEAQEGMSITDADGKILRVNRAFTEMTGYGPADALGCNMRLLHSGRQDAAFYSAMWRQINSTGAWEGEIWNRRKNGEIYPEHLTITAVKDAHGLVTNYVGTHTDITSNKAAEEEIRQLAFYDPLTGLPNRRLLMDRLQQALSSSTRSGLSGALLFIDLDHFKLLNDTLGHDVGDLLLQQVARRLELAVREGDTVARLGGDEFVVMLEGLSRGENEAGQQASYVGNKILDVLNQPYQLATHEYHCTPSIGGALFNDNAQTMDELIRRADVAMYQSKKAGRNALCFFAPSMQDADSG